ncbi:MAG: PHP domain-containing protein [Chloroflexi bacterium]|nr:MAG: PHP domain-containing protein [Chloroflexota bacterium]
MTQRGLADLHLHTSFSDGWPSPAEVVDHVTLHTSLDVVAITDHDTVEGALRAAEYARSTLSPVVVIVGEEVSSRQGHILGLFLERRIRPGLSAAETVEEIHAQGGLAIAAHPFWRTERMATRFRGPVHGTGWLAAELDFDAVEVENSTPGLGLANRLARRLAEATGLAAVGGSDAHILPAIGKSATSFRGRSARALRSALENCTTRPVRSRYEVSALLRYAAWGINHERVATVSAQLPERLRA